MPLWIDIALVLGALTLFECAFWLPYGAVAILTGRRGRGRVAFPGSIGSRRGGLAFGPVIPTRDRFVVRSLPFLVSPDGLAIGRVHEFSPADDPGEIGPALAVDDLASVRAEDHLVRAGRTVLGRFASRTEAERIAAELSELAGTARDERDDTVRGWLSQRLDAAEAKRAADRFREQTEELRGSVVGLATWVYVAVPLVLAWPGPAWRWIALAGGWMLLLALHLPVYWRAHAGLFPDDRKSRRADLLIQIVAPVSAVYSHVHLSQRALEGRDPLAAAAALARDDAVRLGRYLLHARGRDPATSPSGSISSNNHGPAVWFVGAFQTSARDGLPAEVRRALERTPEPESRDSRTFCPRCLDQYRIEAGVCVACGGLPLVAFGEGDGPDPDDDPGGS